MHDISYFNPSPKARHIHFQGLPTTSSKPQSAPYHSDKQEEPGDDYAWTIGRRFELAAKRLGLNKGYTPLRTDLFNPPQADGQLSLPL